MSACDGEISAEDVARACLVGYVILDGSWKRNRLSICPCTGWEAE